jgi:spore germination cell wall hydrolase CwlJ-like protein
MNWRDDYLPDPGKPLGAQPVEVLAAQNIWSEARNQPWLGKVAVGNIVWNRANDKRDRWPKYIPHVILQHKQFSWTLSDALIQKALRPLDYDGEEVWRICVCAALATVDGIHPDVTLGANFYCNVKVTLGLPHGWEAYQRIISIGDHTFFKA